MQIIYMYYDITDSVTIYVTQTKSKVVISGRPDVWQSVAAHIYWTNDMFMTSAEEEVNNDV